MQPGLQRMDLAQVPARITFGTLCSILQPLHCSATFKEDGKSWLSDTGKCARRQQHPKELA
jgi:hypothetical protein